MQELPVRFVRVVSTRHVTPHTVRVTFGGDDLAGLVPGLAALGPDQQVKLYFPRPGQDVPRLPAADADMASWYAAYTALPDAERPWMRSYTIRAHDARNATVDVDFVLHPHAGPATRWAQRARPGDVLGMFGPDGPYARPVPLQACIADAGWLLMAGDETALPAIATLAEALPPGGRALAFVEVAGPAEEQPLRCAADLTVRWVHRGGVPAGHGTALVDAVRAAWFPAGRVFAWLGGEAGAVRALRRHLVDERGVEKAAIEFSGYWRPRRDQDAPPTEEDVAEAGEMVAAVQERAARLRANR